uniref:Uncharacterized protein n=1 Tax=Arundo donax TaxID=35708 RepID=A0A0A9BKH7_ARUDO
MANPALPQGGRRARLFLIHPSSSLNFQSSPSLALPPVDDCYCSFSSSASVCCVVGSSVPRRRYIEWI